MNTLENIFANTCAGISVIESYKWNFGEDSKVLLPLTRYNHTHFLRASQTFIFVTLIFVTFANFK